jgi:4-alpha-glucanotransferase
MSQAALVIAPIQDLLGYGGDTRINIPGTAEGNWRFRVTEDALAKIDTDFYRRLAAVFDRAGRL